MAPLYKRLSLAVVAWWKQQGSPVRTISFALALAFGVFTVFQLRLLAKDVMASGYLLRGGGFELAPGTSSAQSK